MSDNLTDRLQRAADRFVAASLERGFVYGTVGRQNENGGYSVVVAGRPNYLYVTVDGEQASTIARGGSTPRVAGLPVRMKREQGELVIVDVNQLALGAFLSGGAGGYNVAFHHHNEGSGLEYAINSSRLKPGRVRYVSALTVHIGEFAYSHLGDWRWWPGGNINLTSVQPTTAGEWAWVLVGVDPATNAAVAVAGESQAVGAALTVDQLEDVAFNGYIPCGAVRVREDDTALNLASRYADARIWLDRLGASGGGDVAGEIDGATEKTAPDGTDKFGLVEGGLLKWLSWDNLAAGVQAALDSVYFRLTGRAGGQVAHGGTDSGDMLTLRGSSHATSGGVLVDDDLAVDGIVHANTNITSQLPSALHFGVPILSGAANGPIDISIHTAVDDGVNRPGFAFIRSRNTVASPAALVNGDPVGLIAFKGFDGSGVPLTGLIEARVDGVVSTGTVPISLHLVTGTTSGSRATRVLVSSVGNVAIGPSAPAASAKLDIQGTNGALLLPRLTTTQRNALTPTFGMIIANVTSGRAEFYNGSAWVSMS